MCLLTFLPAGVQPDTVALSLGAMANGDGHGFAIITRARTSRAAGTDASAGILIAHGLDGEELIEQFALLRAQNPDGPALFHSRFATHGDTSIENCHPFRVGGDQRTVLAHNGVLPQVVQPGRGEVRSDTRITAEDFLPRFGHLATRARRRRFEKWMTARNKIVILSVDPRFRQQAYILNERAGIWQDRIWYSNDDFRYRPLLEKGSLLGEPVSWARWTSSREPGLCGSCGQVMYPGERECLECGWCLDCHQQAENCLCYLHPRARHGWDFPGRSVP